VVGGDLVTRGDADVEPGRFRLDDFELYRIARAYRKRVYEVIKELPVEDGTV
jgi:hypothetical protein